MIDARGYSCPEPVIMAQKALATQEQEYEMLVDSRTAMENVTRYVSHNGVYGCFRQLKETTTNLSSRKNSM